MKSSLNLQITKYLIMIAPSTDVRVLAVLSDIWVPQWSFNTYFWGENIMLTICGESCLWTGFYLWRSRTLTEKLTAYDPTSCSDLPSQIKITALKDTLCPSFHSSFSGLQEGFKPSPVCHRANTDTEDNHSHLNLHIWWWESN